MQQIVYIDILLAINFIIDYFLLRLTSLLTGQSTSGKRLVLTAALASLSSLMIFLPKLPSVLSVLLNLSFSALISAAAFGVGGWYGFVLRTTAFYGVNLLYAGGMLILCRTLKPEQILFYQGILYFPLSPIRLIFWACALYFCVKLFHLSLKNGRIIEKSTVVLLTYHNKTIHLKGITDTGNHAFDPYSGKPVLFCSAVSLRPLIGEDGICWMQQRKWLTTDTEPPFPFRLLPLRYIAGETLLPVFYPEKLELQKDGHFQTINAAVAITPHPFREGYDLLLHPELTEQSTQSFSIKEGLGIQ